MGNKLNLMIDVNNKRLSVLKYLKVLLLLFVLVAISPKDLIADPADPVAVVAESRAIDLRIKKYANHKSLVDLLTKSYSKEYKSKVLGKRITPQVKAIIDEKYEGKVEDYISARFPENVDILDKTRNYVLVFFRINDQSSIKILNALQKKYLHNIVITAVLSPLVKRVGKYKRTAKGMGIDPIDPTFFPRNQKAYVNYFKKVSKKPGFEEPEFLVCFDEARSLGDPKKLYMAQHKYAMKYRTYGKTFNMSTFAVVVNKQNDILWMGQPKDVGYYMKVVGTKTYNWQDNKKAFHTMKEQDKYLSLRRSPKNIPNLEKQIEGFYNDVIGTPEMLVDFGLKIMQGGLYEYKDPVLVLKLIDNASKLLGPKDSRVLTMYLNYYVLTGDLEKVKEKATLLGIEYKSTMDAENFNKYQKAKLIFSNKYWPYLSKVPNLISEAEARVVEKSLLEGMLIKPRFFADVLSYLVRSPANLCDNKHFSEFVVNCHKSTMTKIKEDEINFENYRIFEAYSFFYMIKKQYKISAEMMKKVVDCIKLGKNRQNVLRYKAMLSVISKKIK